MSIGALSSSEAAKNNVARKIIHDEIYQIEKEIRTTSEKNQNKLTVDFTPITSKTLESFVLVENVNITTDTITITSHGLIDDDVVEIKSTLTLPNPLLADVFYGIKVLDADSFQLYELADVSKTPINITTIGDGTIQTRKVITSEIFLRAWEKYYTFPFSESYIFIMENVENHFRKNGFMITRLKDGTNNTLKWLIRW